MKKLIILLVLTTSCAVTRAQNYSNWIIASNHPSLKVRWAKTKDANNYSYLRLELQSSTGCKFRVTASVCRDDASDRNGWKYVTLIKDRSYFLSFKILNSCDNGFWWWYKDYKLTAVNID